jgi:benzoate-CoA ligase family protein
MGSPPSSDRHPLRIPDPFNIASYFIDRNLELGRGGNVAVLEDGRKFSYTQLAELVNRAGNAFRSVGAEPENRILLAVPDCAEFIAAFFGAAKIGAVPIPVNTGAKPEDYVYFLNDSGAKIFVMHEELWPQLKGLLSEVRSLRHVLIVPCVPPKMATVIEPPPPGASHGWRLFADLLGDSSATLEAEKTSKDDLAFILYTSGSTGGPKGAVHLQHDMLVATELYARGILGVGERDICFSASKLFFAYGLGNGSYFPFSVGAAAVYSPHRPKPEIIFDYLEKFRPTLFFGVPTLFAAMLQVEGKKDLRGIRYAVSAGEALPADLYQRFLDRFGISILDGIGSTEMLHIFISNRPGDIEPGTSGKIVPGYEARIVDDQGLELPNGEIGNLWVKGDSAAAFYWKKQERSKRVMIGEWLVTGDKYYVDEKGVFTYCGRADDMIKVSGQWVSPVEVENALIACPSVLEAAVVGHQDTDGLVKPKAFVVLKSQAASGSGEELRNFLHDKIPGYKCPRWFEFVRELPKTPTGKIQRFKLRGQ